MAVQTGHEGRMWKRARPMRPRRRVMTARADTTCGGNPPPWRACTVTFMATTGIEPSTTSSNSRTRTVRASSISPTCVRTRESNRRTSGTKKTRQNLGEGSSNSLW